MTEKCDSRCAIVELISDRYSLEILDDERKKANIFRSKLIHT